MTKAELYFGCDIDRLNRRVTGREIADFLSDVVSPRFPGFTVLHGQGYWEGKPENSFVVVIISGGYSGDLQKRIKEIIDYYKKTYYQDSVGCITYDVKADF